MRVNYLRIVEIRKIFFEFFFFSMPGSVEPESRINRSQSQGPSTEPLDENGELYVLLWTQHPMDGTIESITNRQPLT